MSMTYGITEAATMKAEFQAKPMTLSEPPNLKLPLEILKHIMNCAQSSRIPGMPLGKLYICVRAVVYALFTPVVYPTRRANPGNRPFYAPNASAPARKTSDDLFAISYRFYHDECTMDEILIGRFFEILGPAEQDLQHTIISMPNSTF